MRASLLAFLTTIFLAPAASAEIISRTSPHPVSQTVDRLAAAAENAGATVFARVDHAAGAARIGAELRPTQLLIFGNPKIGTPAMQQNQTAGLDLPLRVLVYEDENGVTTIAYAAPSNLAEAHGLPPNASYLQTMAGALDNLTSAAAE